MEAAVQQSYEAALERLREIWALIGVPEEQGKAQLLHQISEIYDGAVADLQRHKLELEEELRSKNDRVRHIRNELGLDVGEETLEEHEAPQDTLLQKVDAVRALVDDLELQRRTRSEEIQALLDRIAALATALGTAEDSELGTDITSARCQMLRQKKESLDVLLRQREQDVSQRVDELAALIDELDLAGEREAEHDELDKLVMASNKAAIGVQATTLRHLERRHEELLVEKESRQAQLQELAVDITALWDRLQISAEERMAFLGDHSGLGLDTIRACEDELRRLKECKAASLKELIRQARLRLAALWDECLISEEERQSFAPAYSTALTDESLEAHDIQIARMETRAQAIRPLLKLVAKRDALLDDKRALEESCLDPNRFRIPGRLIQEEKTRKMLQKRLPLVEQKLREGVADWERQQNAVFTVDGKRFLDCMKVEGENVANERQTQKVRAKVNEQQSSPRRRLTVETPKKLDEMTMLQRRRSMAPAPVSAAAGSPKSTRRGSMSVRRPRKRAVLVPLDAVRSPNRS